MRLRSLLSLALACFVFGCDGPDRVAIPPDGGAADGGLNGTTGWDSIAAGGDGAASDGAAVDAPSSAQDGQKTGPFAAIHHEIFVKYGCTGEYCHGAGAGGLRLYETDVAGNHARLVGAKARSRAKSSCVTQDMVVAGEPDKSLLWLKIDRVAVHGCGAKMPPGDGGEPDGLPPAASAKLRAWIAAGAPL